MTYHYRPNDYVLYILFVENLGGGWSSGAWDPGPNGPVVDPPLRVHVHNYYNKIQCLFIDDG